MIDLRVPTSLAWLQAVLRDFDPFLLDHAACERKASATGLAFVAKYPDRTELIEPMIAFAREELEHFHQVYKLIEARGLRLKLDERDPYVRPLLALLRGPSEERLLDRLLLAGIVEARGCERFGLVAQGLEPGPLKEFYLDITRSEARHQGLFLRMAKRFFEDSVIQPRLEELLDHEAELIKQLPIRSALH